ncbi:MAG: Polysaccharide biosynthesis protein [candidate division TA06 bacterium ADurb.Bin417]|uniref:Polysaccharide biosynthesis protein n=1 Tax=candidate division TA06 bacterium ADurb.Bin417 TaxID=1852828 RepID=A0A1V5MHW1_UNCT6|nr:MAG: Polysaccharide biosynthesis protein [candidate division TA06 bacterium ADurb.Bin417]
MNNGGSGFGNRLIRNTLFNIGGQFWAVLIAFFLTPYIIRQVGIARYGIWAMISVLTGYFGLFDLGLGQSFEKFIAEYRTSREEVKLNQVVNSGLVFYALLGLLMILVAGAAVEPLTGIFRIPSDLRAEARYLFFWGVVAFSIGNLFRVFTVIQTGFQRMDISNKLGVAVSLLNLAGVILVLGKGLGLRGLMLNSLVITSITGLASMVIAFRLFPSLSLGLHALNPTSLRTLSWFGIKRWVTSIEDVITYQTDKLLISHFLNISLVGFYQLGFTIADKAAYLVRLLTSAVVPAASELDTRGQREKIIRLQSRGLKYISLTGFPIFAFTLATAPVLVFAWLGPGYGNSVLVLRIFSLVMMMALLGSISSAIAVGIGHPEFQMLAGGGQAILNLILSLILVLRIGFPGVVLATLVSISLSNTYFMVKFYRFLGTSLVSALRECVWKPMAVAVCLAVPLAILNRLPRLQELSRPAALAWLALEGALFFPLFLLLIRKTGFLAEEDRQMFKKIISLRLS